RNLAELRDVPIVEIELVADAADDGHAETVLPEKGDEDRAIEIRQTVQVHLRIVSHRNQIERHERTNSRRDSRCGDALWKNLARDNRRHYVSPDEALAFDQGTGCLVAEVNCIEQAE